MRLIGLDPDLLFEVTGDTARINRNWRHDREAFRPVEAGALQALRDLVAECRFDVPEALPKALATLVGFFAYETIGLVERIPRAAGAGLDLPDAGEIRVAVSNAAAEYRLYDIAEYDFTPDAYAYVAPDDNPSNVTAIVVDRFELAPAPAAAAP